MYIYKLKIKWGFNKEKKLERGVARKPIVANPRISSPASKDLTDF
jgi:hypothetical protein